MSIGVSRASFVVCATALLFASAASGASILTPFNVIVSGNFSDENADVEGGLAVGGIATLTSFGIATTMLGETMDAFTKGATLDVGTSMTVVNSAALAYGNYYIGGTIPGTFYDNGGGTKLTSDPITSWTGTGSTFAAFQTQSNTYNGDAVKGANLTVNGNTTTINVTGTGMNVIDVPITDLESGHSVYITNATYSNYVIIDVTGLSAGQTYTWASNISIDGQTNNDPGAEDVLFNFYTTGAFNLTLEGSDAGSILAPNAKVTGGGGTFNGSLVAASFGYGSSGGTEFHNFIFTSGTPEPAPIACVGLGLIALACVRRRRRRA
jgi:choice-of-anchor A domain-containing protein/MYXO-CTERM domain-containing protein